MFFLAVTDGIRDIKPPVYFKTDLTLLLLLLSAILLAAFTFLLFFIYKKAKARREKLPQTPPKSAYEIACEALEKLKDENLPSRGLVKEYYYRLSDIVRRYIEETFRIKAPEMTTEEFLYSLKNSNALLGVHKNLLKEFLVFSDIVKFARYGPNEEEVEKSFNLARRFVDETSFQRGAENSTPHLTDTHSEKKEKEVQGRYEK